MKISKKHKTTQEFNSSHLSLRLMCALVFVLCALNLERCKKFVQIPPPNSQLVTASVFSNSSLATSAVTSIYEKMWGASESPAMALNMGLYADELKNYSITNAQQTQLYTNSLPAISNYGPWQNYYLYIFYANSVISGLQSTAGCSQAVKNQLTGEALFIRAFLHFYLTNIYGAVPLALTTNPNITGKLARMPRVQVMQQVIADLQNAASLLNNNYVDGTDTVVTMERVRPNKAAALALLARAYLYMGDYNTSNATSYYVKADSAASLVIANKSNNYSLSPLSGVFLENSTEAIWQWETPQPASFDTHDAQYFVLTGAPNSSGYGIALSTQLLNSFETGDQRLTNWVGSVTVGSATYYFPYKYKVFNQYLNQEYTMVLRLGEQYLIRAEAEAEEGGAEKTQLAQNDLNKIRNRAGLPNYAGATDKASLLAAILHERQVELFCEWGHRYFDLARTKTNGQSNAALVLGMPGDVCKYKGGNWNTNNYQLLFPVPQNDILADINLTQNTGY